MDEIFTTAPTDNHRLPKEMRVYQLLEKLQIPFERMDHEVADTMEACEKIDEKLQVTMCKNLFLCNRQKTTFFLLLMPGDKQLGISRLSFAEAEYMEKFLDITPGSVSVLGLMNDVEKQVTLIIDKDLLEGEYIGCHPCVNTSSLKLKTSDILEKFLTYTGHTPTLVTL